MSADLAGWLVIEPPSRARLRFEGSIDGAAIALDFVSDEGGFRHRALPSDGTALVFRNRGAANAATGVVHIWLRLGLYDLLAKISAGIPPDGLRAAADRWISLDKVARSGQRPTTLSVRTSVDGWLTSSAQVTIGPHCWPVARTASIAFESGTLEVRETYTVTREPRGVDTALTF